MNVNSLVNEKTNVEDLISSHQASSLTGYSSDYISRLCRSGRIAGRKFGRSWFVHKESLLTFIEQAESDREIRWDVLSQTRKDEYQRCAKEEMLSEGCCLLLSDMQDPMSPIKSSDITASVAPPVQSTWPLKSVFLISVALIAFVAMSLDIGISDVHQVTVPVASLASVGSVIETIRILWSGSVGALSDFYSWLTERSPYVVQKQNSPKPPSDPSVLLQEPQENKLPEPKQGALVVVPASNDPVTDQEKFEQVKQSFSDEVTVEPSSDGQTGTIKPVFKNKNNDSYLYVLVPMKEAR